MGEWQKAELLGKDIAYLIALNEGMQHGSTATTEDLQELQDYLDVTADAWLLDLEGMQKGVISKYCAEESTGDCSASVTIVMDQSLRIQFLGATHETEGASALDVMLELADE